MKWGRNESVIWPPHGPINAYAAVFLSVAAAGLFIYLRFSFALTPLQQFYLPYYVCSGVQGMMHKADKYGLLMVLGREGPARLATDGDVIWRQKKTPSAKQLPLELSPAGISQGLIYLYQQPKTSYPNKPLYSYFQAAIYGDQDLWDIFRAPVLFGLAGSRCSSRLPSPETSRDAKNCGTAADSGGQSGSTQSSSMSVSKAMESGLKPILQRRWFAYRRGLRLNTSRS